MDKQETPSRFIAPDRVEALRSRQTAILAEIEALTQTASNDTSLNRDYNASLRQEYNEIVEKRAELESSHLVDPLQALPADIWPNIFEQHLRDVEFPVDALLKLTLISRTWSTSVIALAELWTHIHLDPSKADYLAKALLGIHLSGGREIELYFGDITLGEWRKISSRIVPESNRIKYLSFADISAERPADLELEILKDLSDMPVLRHMILSRSRVRKIHAPFQDYLREFEINGMPSLKAIDGLRVSKQSSPLDRLITYCGLEVDGLQQEDVIALSRLTGLTDLSIVDTAERREESEDSDSHMVSFFRHVNNLNYRGPDLLHCLKWIGTNLSGLSVTHTPNLHPSTLLLAISCFPCLESLSFYTDGGFGDWPTREASIMPKFELSINHLVLIEYGDGESDLAGWDSFVSELMAVTPRMESIFTRNTPLTDIMMAYILSRKKLQWLCIKDYQTRRLTSHPSLGITSLEWGSDEGGIEFLLQTIRSPTLRSLKIVIDQQAIRAALASQNDGQDMQLRHYKVPNNALPNLAELTISMFIPAVWGMGSLPNLRDLRLVGGVEAALSNDWKSDILEALLLRPRDTPALQKITLSGDYYDWDVLILLLERKNLISKPGIARVEALVFDRELPYKLVHPLTELLGGKFVERDSNSSFSVEAIGQRNSPRSSKGCLRCCYIFKQCSSRPKLHTIYGNPRWVSLLTLFNRDHAVPFEYMVADPPLHPEVTEWLLGKRERREAYVKGYKDTARKFHREDRCIDSSILSLNSVITRYSLADTRLNSNAPDGKDV